MLSDSVARSLRVLLFFHRQLSPPLECGRVRSRTCEGAVRSWLQYGVQHAIPCPSASSSSSVLDAVVRSSSVDEQRGLFCPKEVRPDPLGTNSILPPRPENIIFCARRDPSICELPPQRPAPRYLSSNGLLTLPSGIFKDLTKLDVL